MLFTSGKVCSACILFSSTSIIAEKYLTLPSDATERAVALQSVVNGLEDQLKHQEEEANTVITKWQENCTVSEEKCAQLEKQVESLTIEKSSFSEAQESLQNAVDELSSELQAAEKKASQAEEDRQDMVKTWSTSEITIEILKEDAESREKTITELKTELEDSRDQRRELESKLRNQLEECKAELTRTMNELETERNSERNEHDDLVRKLYDEKASHFETRDAVATLRKELVDIRTDSEDVVNRWTGKYSSGDCHGFVVFDDLSLNIYYYVLAERAEELEATIKELEKQLEQQESEANEAISRWELKANDLETELEATTKQLNELKSTDALMAERPSAMSDADKLKTHVAELEKSLEEQRETISRFESDRFREAESRDELDSELSRLTDRCSAFVESEMEVKTALEFAKEEQQSLKQKLAELENQLQKERSRLKERVETKGTEQLEQERDRLTFVIGQLEEELREADDMVQTYVTDEASGRATELAAQILRNEIEELRYQIEENRQAFMTEKSARVTAEQEVERLQTDLAAVLSLSDYEDAVKEVQLLSVKAAEKLQKKERAEMEQLRQSLYRAMDELEAARAAEKEANENLSKARLQASVCEQETIAAKSDLSFMAQTMEEMREAEENRRASLEYRISSLENDHDVLRRYHSGEIENLRNELAQVTMEKDRILQSLKDSEKTNSALVSAAFKGETEEEDNTDPAAELSKLRIENAHLLTMAADDNARTERRLRESLAAQASSAEADAILERELRIAAEASAQTLKVELKELREASGTKVGSRDEERTKVLDTLAAEVARLKMDTQKLKNENANLLRKLEQANATAKAEIDAMTEDCRKAQARAHKLEREGRYDAAVKSEVARLRMSPGLTQEQRDVGSDDWMLVSEDPTADRRESPFAGADAYDYIQRQKEAIQEERKMYLELLSEHDDLLALLFQQDQERASLRAALADAGGQEAVDKAMEEAQSQSLAQFGTL
jgi:hypothetical protein